MTPWLLEREGVRRFTVLLSHWHLDHIAGNAAFADCEIIASERTAEVLVRLRPAIERGELEGPPPIDPLIGPTRTFSDRLALTVAGVDLELMRSRRRPPSRFRRSRPETPEWGVCPNLGGERRATAVSTSRTTISAWRASGSRCWPSAQEENWLRRSMTSKWAERSSKRERTFRARSGTCATS